MGGTIFQENIKIVPAIPGLVEKISKIINENGMNSAANPLEYATAICIALKANGLDPRKCPHIVNLILSIIAHESGFREVAPLVYRNGMKWIDETVFDSSTLGPMQVRVGLAKRLAELGKLPKLGDTREKLGTVQFGLLAGITHLVNILRTYNIDMMPFTSSKANEIAGTYAQFIFADYQSGEFSSRMAAYQDTTNRLLEKQGLPRISVDGNMGNATYSGIRALMDLGIITADQEERLNFARSTTRNAPFIKFFKLGIFKQLREIREREFKVVSPDYEIPFDSKTSGHPVLRNRPKTTAEYVDMCMNFYRKLESEEGTIKTKRKLTSR
ncbi:DUF1615 family protein [Candidatus Micrarchaeota archaeon]|nr:DUF1615 family protein [Candidatus Micrarchaeota archaeon]